LGRKKVTQLFNTHSMKRRSLLILAVLFVSFSSFAQSYHELVKQAFQYYGAKDYTRSIGLYRQAFTIDPNNYNDLYNGACSAALAGEIETAFDWLNLSIEKGWLNMNHLQQDADLVALHNHVAWQKTLNVLQEKVNKIEANYDWPLQAELLRIFKEDQDIRRQYIDATKKYGYQHPVVDSLSSLMIISDSVNLEKVVKILDTKGWVGKDKVGEQANQALFLVIQHADLKTQEKYLPLMRTAVKLGNAPGNALALLEDRVALGEGKKQVYGSQVGRNTKTNRYYVLPLADPDHVDKRRREAGLGPLADYLKNWDITWDAEQYKKDLPEIEKWNKGEY